MKMSAKEGLHADSLALYYEAWRQVKVLEGIALRTRCADASHPWKLLKVGTTRDTDSMQDRWCPYLARKAATDIMQHLLGAYLARKTGTGTMQDRRCP